MDKNKFLFWVVFVTYVFFSVFGFLFKPVVVFWLAAWAFWPIVLVVYKNELIKNWRDTWSGNRLPLTLNYLSNLGLFAQFALVGYFGLLFVLAILGFGFHQYLLHKAVRV